MMQMYLQDSYYGGKALLKEETMDRFNTCIGKIKIFTTWNWFWQTTVKVVDLLVVVYYV
jgi:hypothetical protein